MEGAKRRYIFAESLMTLVKQNKDTKATQDAQCKCISFKYIR